MITENEGKYPLSEFKVAWLEDGSIDCSVKFKNASAEYYAKHTTNCLDKSMLYVIEQAIKMRDQFVKM